MSAVKMNDYGFPVVDRAEQARIIAAGARERLAAKPCDCRECQVTRNLPGVLRILAKWTPMDRSVP